MVVSASPAVTLANCTAIFRLPGGDITAQNGLDLTWKNQYTMRSPALFGQTLGIHNAAAFFIIGAITGAVLLLGIALMLAGTRRKSIKARRRRAERNEAKNAGRERDSAREENAKLHRQLDGASEAHSSGATASG